MTFDAIWILGPAWIATIATICIIWAKGDHLNVSPVSWLILIVGIDVAHVYSTLFRTYFDKEQRQRYHNHLLYIPLFSWIIGVLAYSLSASLFWTTLTYLAVFHFIRQQYGFMVLYGRRELDLPPWCRVVDKTAIYLATLYPLADWHSRLPRRFYWLIEGDFITGLPQWVASLLGWCLLTTLLIYLSKELYLLREYRYFNVPRNLLLGGTAMAWYIGIIALNADLPFTVTNVIAHGVPYMALVWLYGRRKSSSSAFSGILYRSYSVPLLVLIVFSLAYFEEGLWDALIWRDHRELFGMFNWLPKLERKETLALAIPLLAVPQATHYTLDAFIWRVRRPDRGVEELLGAGVR
jgi:hypothetical protein